MNILYYSKFNMYASWKRIRSQEFALSQDKITKVADKLSISVRTVETHRSKIMKKLNVSNASEMIRYALDKKLI